MSLKNSSTFLSSLGESEEGCTLSGVEGAEVICQERQRNQWVMGVQLEKTMMSSGLIIL